MALAVRPLKPVPNEDILNVIRSHGSSDYQSRIPEATKANMNEMLENLTNPSNRNLWNEFTDALMNRIGLVVGRNKSWTNPLAEFKLGMMTHGTMIEEYQVGLIKAQSYDGDRDHLEKDIFGRADVDIQSSFHVRNRQDVYKITINQAQLRGAFLDPMGLGKFVNDIMAAPATSDQWDEFLLTCQLFAEYEKNGGFAKIQIPNVKDIASGGVEAKAALRAMRGLAAELKFPSTKYNAAHMPTFARPEDLVIFTTPSFEAALDVEALAGAFNLDKATAAGRMVTIPESAMNIYGAQAIVTTKDFFVIADTHYEMASAWNPRSLHNNYFLHHWEVISASRFVPAVMLTDQPVREEIEVSTPVVSVSAVTVEDRDGKTVAAVERGQLYNVAAKALTAPADGENDGVRYGITNPTSSRTRVTNEGVLYVGGDEGAETLTVTATATWLDPENIRRAGESNSVTLTVTGDAVVVWPLPEEPGEAATMSLGKRSESDGGESDGGEPAGGKYGELSNDDLRTELRNRELSVTGVKSELIDRLVADDSAKELAAATE